MIVCVFPNNFVLMEAICLKYFNMPPCLTQTNSALRLGHFALFIKEDVSSRANWQVSYAKK